MKSEIDLNPSNTVPSRDFLISRFRFYEFGTFETKRRRRAPRPLVDRPGAICLGPVAEPPDYPTRHLAFRPSGKELSQCPRCERPGVRTYRRRCGDQWLYCPDCGFGTDVPGYVAEMLRVPLCDAVKYLARQHRLKHVDEREIGRYLEGQSGYDRLARLLQERFRYNYSPDDPDAGHGLNVVELERLLGRLNLLQYMKNFDFRLRAVKNDTPRHTAYAERELPLEWESPLDFPVDFFVVETARHVESWFFPNLIDPETKKIKPNTSPNRLFKGPGWDQVLVVPLQDVPGHFCGVLCIGRKGSYPDDYVLRLLPDYDCRTTNPGFLLPAKNVQAMIRLENQGASELLATTDLLHMIRIQLQFGGPSQCRHPLIGWIDRLESAPSVLPSDWSPFRSIKNKVFWIQGCRDPVTLRTVIEQEGHIVDYDMKSPYPCPQKETFHSFRPNPVALMKMRIDAVPWRNFLDARLSHLSPEKAAEELLRIAVTPRKFELLLAQLPKSAQKQAVKRTVQREQNQPSFQVGRYEVFEEPAGLFRKTSKQKSPSFVSDVVCRIDSVFYDPHRVKRIYRGHIRHEGKSFRFDIPVKEFDRNVIESVKILVERKGLTEPVFRCKNRFYRQVVEAMSKQRPVHPPHFTGWNGKTKNFEFPQFRIMHRRGVVPAPNRAKMLSDEFPAKFIGSNVFEELPKIDMSGPARDFIPFYVGLLSLALRPMFGDPRPVFVSGVDFNILRPIADSLGMPIVTLKGDTDVDRVLKYNARHRWPMLVAGAFERESMYIRRMSKTKSGSTVFYLDDPEQARSAALFHSDSKPILLPSGRRQSDDDWQDRLPVLAAIFFQRLVHYARNRPKFQSPQTFFYREAIIWREYLQPADGT